MNGESQLARPLHYCHTYTSTTVNMPSLKLRVIIEEGINNFDGRRSVWSDGRTGISILPSSTIGSSVVAAVE